MRGSIQQVLAALKAAASGLTIGNSSQSTEATSGTTITWSHTCIAGANLLVVSCIVRGTGAIPTLSATYNGVAMTLKPSTDQTIGSLRRVATFTIDSNALSFDTSAHNVVITSTQTITSGFGGAKDYGGVDINGTPFGTLATASGTSTSPTVSISCATNDIAYAFVGSDSGGNATPGNSQTEIFDIAVALNAGVAGYKTSPSASQAMGWTIANVGWVEHGFAIKPAP